MDTDKTTTEFKVSVSCDICMKEIPSGKGKISEVDDYVMHFCGLECYEKWNKQEDKHKNNK